MILSAAGATPRILVFDDDPGVLELETEILQFAGYQVIAAMTAEHTVELAADGRFDLAVVDLGRRGRNEFVLLDRLLAIAEGIPVIVLSGFDAASAVQAIRRGAYGFLTKPVDVDRFLETVRAALRSHQSVPIPQTHPEDSVPFLTQSEAMLPVYRKTEEAAQSSANVLILGEPGTGKEALARSIYRRSRRADEPFIRLVCAGLTKGRLSEELFGRDPGALPDTAAAAAGVLERAGKGTVLIKDPDMLPVESQYSLLEAIQKGMITRISGDKTTPLEARIFSTVSARPGEPANLDPLRDDLCYLLSHIVISIPPLRERPEDIPALVSHSLEIVFGKGCAPLLPQELVEGLSRHPWPGNVDQLTSLVRKAASRKNVAIEQSIRDALDQLATGESLRRGLTGLQGNADQNPSHDPEDHQ